MLWKPDKSARGPITHVEETNQRSFDNAFVYLHIVICSIHEYTPMAASSIMSLLKRSLNFSDEEVFAIIFWASNGKLLKKN